MADGRAGRRQLAGAVRARPRAGLRCETAADVDATIKRALEINDQPVVIDFTVSRDAMVWPMVAAGVSNDQIQYARGISPAWDREE